METQSSFVPMDFDFDIHWIWCQESIMIHGSLPLCAARWISLLGQCSPACVMDLFGNKTAVVWNTWVVSQSVFQWLRFQLSNVSSQSLGQLGQLYIRDKMWPPLTGCRRKKMPEVKEKCWDPKAAASQIDLKSHLQMLDESSHWIGFHMAHLLLGVFSWQKNQVSLILV